MAHYQNYENITGLKLGTLEDYTVFDRNLKLAQISSYSLNEQPGGGGGWSHDTKQEALDYIYEKYNLTEFGTEIILPKNLNEEIIIPFFETGTKLVIICYSIIEQEDGIFRSYRFNMYYGDELVATSANGLKYYNSEWNEEYHNQFRGTIRNEGTAATRKANLFFLMWSTSQSPSTGKWDHSFATLKMNGNYDIFSGLNRIQTDGPFTDDPYPEEEPPTMNEFYFYNHSKKVNSTKQPTGGTKIEGYFREPFNLLNPVLHIEADNEFPYNYCKWHDSANNLDRYYWIQNKAWMPNRIVELALEEDTLATFKTEIGATSAFIKRSASNFNPLITDESWVTKNGPDISHQTPIGTPFDVTNGFYVVGIVENDQGTANPCVFDRIGGVDYYACKEAELDDLINFLADLGATGHWGDYRPLDRIVCCRFFPFTLNADSTSLFQNAIWHHSYEDPSGQTVTTNFNWVLHKYSLSGIVSNYCSITPIDHPQAGTDRLYLNYQPYTELELKAGPFGKIDLSMNMIPYDALSNELTLTVTADLISGLTKLQVNSGTEILYFTEDYSATVDIALSQEYVNRYSDLQQRDFNKRSGYVQAAVQGVSGAGATITAAFTQNPMLLATGLALMASTAATADKTNKQYLMDTYNMSVPQVSCRGTNGGWMKISENWRLTEIFHLVAGDGPAILGRPKQDTDLISTCSGYVLCNATSFEDSKAILPEVTLINDFLNNGFYYE